MKTIFFNLYLTPKGGHTLTQYDGICVLHINASKTARSLLCYHGSTRQLQLNASVHFLAKDIFVLIYTHCDLDLNRSQRKSGLQSI